MSAVGTASLAPDVTRPNPKQGAQAACKLAAVDARLAVWIGGNTSTVRAASRAWLVAAAREGSAGAALAYPPQCRAAWASGGRAASGRPGTRAGCPRPCLTVTSARACRSRSCRPARVTAVCSAHACRRASRIWATPRQNHCACHSPTTWFMVCNCRLCGGTAAVRGNSTCLPRAIAPAFPRGLPSGPWLRLQVVQAKPLRLIRRPTLCFRLCAGCCPDVQLAHPGPCTGSARQPENGGAPAEG